MIQNLSQLKKAIRPGTRFEIVKHNKQECIGQIRRVTLANTQGIYSVVESQPEHKFSLCNEGKGAWLAWNKASAWSFQDGTCSQYFAGAHTDENLVLVFRVIEEAA